jgi:hypothetical protein
MKVKCIFRKSSAHTTHLCDFGFWNSICRRFNIKTGLNSHLFRIKPHVQALVARNDHLPPPFFKLSVYVFIFNKISLLSHLFFLNLTCSCPYSYNLMLIEIDMTIVSTPLYSVANKSITCRQGRIYGK